MSNLLNQAEMRRSDVLGVDPCIIGEIEIREPANQNTRPAQVGSVQPQNDDTRLQPQKILSRCNWRDGDDSGAKR